MCSLLDYPSCSKANDCLLDWVSVVYKKKIIDLTWMMTRMIGSSNTYGTVIPNIVKVMTFLVYVTEIHKETSVEVDSMWIYQDESTRGILDRRASYSYIAFPYSNSSVLEFGIWSFTCRFHFCACCVWYIYMEVTCTSLCKTSSWIGAQLAICNTVINTTLQTDHIPHLFIFTSSCYCLQFFIFTFISQQPHFFLLWFSSFILYLHILLFFSSSAFCFSSSVESFPVCSSLFCFFINFDTVFLYTVHFGIVHCFPSHLPVCILIILSFHFFILVS